MSTVWQLRRAQAEDSHQFWEWANDPGVRSMAFSTASIPWESHERWFANRLASPSCHLFLLTNSEGKPAGQIRFDELSERPGVFEIDIGIAPSMRGQGVGRTLLTLGEQALLAAKASAIFRALVKPQNRASLALFRSAGYRENATTAGPLNESVIAFEK